MRKVFHITGRYLHYTATFIGNQVVNHKEFEPQVLCREIISHKSFSFNKIFSIEKSKGLRLKINNLLYKFLKHITNSQIKFVLEHIEAEKPSLLHFHYGTDAMMFYKVLKNSTVPKVVSFYGWDYSSFPKSNFGIGKKQLQKKVFAHSDIILAMSHSMKKALISLGCHGEKIKIHYHGLDTKVFDIDRDYSSNEEINIYLLSSLEPKKGHMFLLKAFKKSAHKSKLPLKLHFTGKYGNYSKINKSIKELGLEKQVVWHAPYQYGSERHLKMLSHADFFVHPSITDSKGNMEGIPGTMLEAMSSGLAVVSTYHAGIPEIITDGENGYLVKEWDVDALTGKILLLAENPELRKKIGIAAKDYAKRNLDINKKQVDLENIYNTLITKKNK